VIFTKLPRDQLTALTIKIGNETIQRVEYTKFLGIQLDDKLNWHEHIKYIKNKLSSGLYALNTSKRLLEREHLIKLYYTLINPHLNYGVTLWGSSKKSDIKQLYIMQNKAIRAITLTRYNESVSHKYKQLGIMQLDNLYIFQITKYMFQYSRNLLPIPLMNLFTPNTNIHAQNTRQRLSRTSKQRNPQIHSISALKNILVVNKTL